VTTDACCATIQYNKVSSLSHRWRGKKQDDFTQVKHHRHFTLSGGQSAAKVYSTFRIMSYLRATKTDRFDVRLRRSFVGVNIRYITSHVGNC